MKEDPKLTEPPRQKRPLDLIGVVVAAGCAVSALLLLHNVVYPHSSSGYVRWGLLASIGAGSALSWRNARRMRAQVETQRLGGCVACGYNQAGIEPGSKCPECGEISVREEKVKE